jgi:hypothetical protein
VGELELYASRLQFIRQTLLLRKNRAAIHNFLWQSGRSGPQVSRHLAKQLIDVMGYWDFIMSAMPLSLAYP